MIAAIAIGGTAASGADSAFAPSRVLYLNDTVDGLAADGLRAAFISYSSVEVWNAHTGSRADGGGSDTAVSEVAISRDLVGYLYFEDTNTLFERGVSVQAPGEGGIETAHTQPADFACARTCVGHVVGHGDLLVYNYWRVRKRANRRPVIERAVLRRVVKGRPGVIAVPVTRGVASLFAAAVDNGRIVLRHPPRTATVITASGTVIATHRFPRNVTSIRLSGTDLVARMPPSIAVYDSNTGRPTQSWRVPANARLEDVADGLVVYVTGRQIHIRRFSDGRDKLIPLPANARPPVRAQLENTGLFYSWALPAKGDDLPTGRLAFAPMARVRALF